MTSFLSAMYYGVSICLVSFASAMAVVTLNVHFRGLRGAEVPRTVKKIFLTMMPRLMFMSMPSFDIEEKDDALAERSDTFEQRERVRTRRIKSLHSFQFLANILISEMLELLQVQHHSE